MRKMDVAEFDPVDDSKNQFSRILAKKLRPSYQYYLLALIRDKDVDSNLLHLEKITEVMEECSASEQAAHLWSIVGALIESLSRDNLPLTVSTKMLIGKVDNIFRRLILKGEQDLQRQQPIKLINNLLYYVARPECDGPKSQAIKTAYRLEQFMPSNKKQAMPASALFAPDQDLLKTVSDADSIPDMAEDQLQVLFAGQSTGSIDIPLQSPAQENLGIKGEAGLRGINHEDPELDDTLVIRQVAETEIDNTLLMVEEDQVEIKFDDTLLTEQDSLAETEIDITLLTEQDSLAETEIDITLLIEQDSLPETEIDSTLLIEKNTLAETEFDSTLLIEQDSLPEIEFDDTLLIVEEDQVEIKIDDTLLIKQDTLAETEFDSTLLIEPDSQPETEFEDTLLIGKNTLADTEFDSTLLIEQDCLVKTEFVATLLMEEEDQVEIKIDDTQLIKQDSLAETEFDDTLLIEEEDQVKVKFDYTLRRYLKWIIK